jgi:hypothetical protein
MREGAAITWSFEVTRAPSNTDGAGEPVRAPGCSLYVGAIDTLVHYIVRQGQLNAKGSFPMPGDTALEFLRRKNECPVT